ncbi:DUF948 domain-containing protein [Planococcus shenhongbingii]|uniref:DUF948 domain-containing protein n=1 Tax=Planococcus shenhongbingii TaxID=3058398 RepID=UPI00262F59EC|nr:DUF948 domain-containing protein [Planococcus sp. N016]WKA57024.1 DUF948 domain-containing protein [Planococcus sp. N016]
MDSTMWLYIALAILIVGLIVAGIGVGLFLKGMKEPLKEIKGSVNNLKERVDKLKLETTSLQHTTNELKEDMQVKSEKVSLFIDAAKGTKNSVVDLNSSVRAITVDVTTRVDQSKENAVQVDQWSNTVVGLVGLWEHRKNAKKRTDTYYPEAAADNEQLRIQ